MSTSGRSYAKEFTFDNRSCIKYLSKNDYLSKNV